LAPLADEKKRIHLDELIRFYQSPAKAFLKQQFSINNFERNHVLPIREPFALESFKDRDIREEVFDALKGDMADEKELSIPLKTVRARGLLPYGDIGDKLFDKEVNIIKTFIEQLPKVDSRDNQFFELKLGDGFTLYGELKNLSQTGRMIQQVGSAFAGDYIRVWFNHLVLNTQSDIKEQSHTAFYSPELSFKLSPIKTAADDLAQLVNYYWQGMQFPLHFYAKPAFKQYQSKQKDAGIKEAIKAWNNNFMGANEKDKFENWLLYRGSDESELFDDEYQEITHLVFGQLFKQYESLE
jgi:exodeoxyribonuclease V gamma subunit